MDIILGSGNSRQKFTVATGQALKALAKENPIEHTKIMGNLKALVRRQPKITVSVGEMARMRKNRG